MYGVRHSTLRYTTQNEVQFETADSGQQLNSDAPVIIDSFPTQTPKGYPLIGIEVSLKAGTAEHTGRRVASRL
jgi:hypothetical protein